jgi:hypothetical protein
MNYSKYFAQMIKQSGMPHLDYRQISRMFNIVSMEGQIKGIERMKELVSDPRVHAYTLYDKQHQLNDLTRKLPPNQVWTEMIKLSTNDLDYRWSTH